MDTKQERELLISCALGDGCVAHHRGQDTHWLQLRHCLNQRDYLFWKVTQIEAMRLVKGRKFSVREKVNRHRNGKNYPLVEATLYGVKYMRILRKWLYRDKRKTASQVLKYLTTSLSLAVLLMDDGSVNRRKRKHKDGTEYFLKPTIRWALCKDAAECDLMLTWLKDTFSIEGYKVRHSRKDAPVTYYLLNFNVENSLYLWRYIAPYVLQLPSMEKKFDLFIETYPEITSQPA